MWKDFFSFTKKERQGIIVLITLVVGICAGKFLFQNRGRNDDFTDIRSIPGQRDSLLLKTENVVQKAAFVNKSPVLKYFDPNTADSMTLVSFGLKPYVAKNIIKYRSKGGVFKNSEDFRKIYGLKADDFERLNPYIRIISQSVKNNEKKEMPYSKTNVYNPDDKFKRTDSIPNTKALKMGPGNYIDINEADTTDWKTVPGIGIAFANRIIKYRKMLGGFYDIGQIVEVYGMNTELFLKITPFLSIVENPELQKISVNTSSLDRLKLHPYVNFYQAKAIVEMRQKKGKLQSFSELSLLEEFTEKDIERLQYYLSFE